MRGVTYKATQNPDLQAYSDSDWASDPDTRRSTTGYVFLFAQGPIAWRSKRQPTVALSTTSAIRTSDGFVKLGSRRGFGGCFGEKGQRVCFWFILPVYSLGKEAFTQSLYIWAPRRPSACVWAAVDHWKSRGYGLLVHPASIKRQYQATSSSTAIKRHHQEASSSGNHQAPPSSGSINKFRKARHRIILAWKSSSGSS